MMLDPFSMGPQKVKNRSILSFPRRRESSLFRRFWTPAPRLPPSGTGFAGVTAWRDSYESVML